jgi:uncharacterized protein (TIGR00730 family)
MTSPSERPESVCVFCASSNPASPRLLADAASFGRRLAEGGVRLVYGGGGVGLMGACALAAQEVGGEVLGIIPEFLVDAERPLHQVPTRVVQSMHERKQMMFEESDSFVVLPGGIGTLEEVVELLSWRRLDLHAKPIVFYSPDGFWEPLFQLFRHTIAHRLTPAEFEGAWTSVERVEDILPAVRRRTHTPPGLTPDLSQVT